jgi:hypothetical protein
MIIILETQAITPPINKPNDLFLRSEVLNIVAHIFQQQRRHRNSPGTSTAGKHLRRADSVVESEERERDRETERERVSKSEQKCRTVNAFGNNLFVWSSVIITAHIIQTTPASTA